MAFMIRSIAGLAIAANVLLPTIAATACTQALITATPAFAEEPSELYGWLDGFKVQAGNKVLCETPWIDAEEKKIDCGAVGDNTVVSIPAGFDLSDYEVGYSHTPENIAGHYNWRVTCTHPVVTDNKVILCH